MARNGAPAGAPSSDRALKRSPLRNYAEYVVAAVAFKRLEWAPPILAQLLGRAYVQLLSSALPRLSFVARRNLSLALPQLPPDQRAAITAGMFRSIVRVLVMLAKFPFIRRENLDNWIRFEGCEHVES